MTPRRTLLPSLVLAAALLAACGGDDDTDDASPDASSEEVVTMEQSRFAPDSLEVAAGTEVSFQNLDPFAHTVTGDDFDSGELGQDEIFQRTFDEAGTYEYFCEIHPTMRAEVVVS